MIFPIDLHWKTTDPFLFCAHHLDLYPPGNERLGPSEGLDGRVLGSDFNLKDGFRMYHGEAVPGFPVHPHRGFETITLVLSGFVDHADSLGACGRYGPGDVQWMTAGSGIQHSEMFPLLNKSEPNPLEILQIWLNLPQKSKMVPAEYKMYWAERIPRFLDRGVKVDIIAGEFRGLSPLTPPTYSWASQLENEVAVWLIELDQGAELQLPSLSPSVHRTLYFFDGSEIFVDDQTLKGGQGITMTHQHPGVLRAQGDSCKVLLLQGRPLSEPVVQSGPFVMNYKSEIAETIFTYQQTQFGGWPWERPDMIHGHEKIRFAKHAGGAIEHPS